MANKTPVKAIFSGSDVTSLGEFASGDTILASLLDGALPAISGASLTALNATNLGSGTVPTARLGSGTANTTVFLRGDGSWQVAGSSSASDLTSGTLPMARLSGTLPALNASALTAIPAANITGTLPAISGVNLTALTATNLGSGTVPTARLGSGTASSSTFLRGDGSWQAAGSPSITDGGNATAITINSAENVGIGTAPKVTSGTYTGVNIGGTGLLLGYKTQENGADIAWANNMYFNSNYYRMFNEEASAVYQNNGTFIFKVAAAGAADSVITWTDAMVINNDGDVVISTKLASDTQTTPETVLSLHASYNSTSSDGVVGTGSRIDFNVPTDEGSELGAAISSTKTDADDGLSNAGLTFYTSQNDQTLDPYMHLSDTGSLRQQNTVEGSTGIAASAKTVTISGLHTLSPGNHWDRGSIWIWCTGTGGGYTNVASRHWRHECQAIGPWTLGGATEIYGGTPPTCAIVSGGTTNDTLQFTVTQPAGNAVLRVIAFCRDMDKFAKITFS